MAISFDRARIDAVLDAACKRLDGEWLLVGGALAALWFEPDRSTEDLDLVGLLGTPAERRQLMTLASELGLPIESVNSAADFFVNSIGDWREHIEVLRSGPRCRIYRPDPTLFLLLKSRRLGEQDLSDCLGMLAKCRQDGMAFDAPRVAAALQALPSTIDAELRHRREALAKALLKGTGKPARRRKRR